MKKITKIQADRNEILKEIKSKKKVVYYSRVSTNSTEQEKSFENQSQYFQKLIAKNKDWELVGEFFDKGKSGRTTTKRDGFLQMIELCEQGKVDIILTKSVTRFARNTVDSIEYIRKLKSLNIAIIFEKEKINTLDQRSELLLTILSSIAQQESENISQNTKWSIRKCFEDGTYKLPCVAFGYEKINEEIVINPEQAKLVRRIFDEYLNGIGSYTIAKNLNRDNINTIRNAKQWSDNVVKGILKNPIYEGNLLLQKTYTTEGAPYTKKRNNEVLPKFLIKDNHEGIITHQEFEMVQEIIEDRRKKSKPQIPSRYPLSGKIKCSECGTTFRRQKIYIGKPYEKVQWCCKLHIQDKTLCSTKAIKESEIDLIFKRMINKLKFSEELVLKAMLESLLKAKESKIKNAKYLELETKIEKLNLTNKELSKQEETDAEKQIEINVKLKELKSQLSQLKKGVEYTKIIKQTQQIQSFLLSVNNLDYSIVERIYVSTDAIIFKLINGLELTEIRNKNSEGNTFKKIILNNEIHSLDEQIKTHQNDINLIYKRAEKVYKLID